MKLTGSAIVALVGLGALLWLWLAYGDQAKKLVTQTLNPASSDNIVNHGATAAVQAITGNPNQTVGGGLFDFLHPRAGLAPDEYIDPNGHIAKRPAAQDLGTIIQGDGSVAAAP